MTNETVKVIPAGVLLENWQGHRRLTRKTIEAFPEEKLFAFSVGGMRPFGKMALEMLGMAVPTVVGVGTGVWEEFKYGTDGSLETKGELLRLWDEHTALLSERFPAIPEARFDEVDKAFGQWEMTGLAVIQYCIDNEIHHRGQGYVYLRELGVEPPAFWDRG